MSMPRTSAREEQKIRIESSSGLSEAEIQRMVRTPTANAAIDKAEKQKIEIKNQAEQLVHQTERTLSDLGGKVAAEDRLRIERAVNDLKDKIKSQDTSAIKEGMGRAYERFS